MDKAHWVLDGSILEDAGDVGGDIQVGPAFSARFRSDDCPEARLDVAMYATAKPYAEVGEPEPKCSHPSVLLESLGGGVGRFAPMPEEHLACSYKPGTVNVQAQYTFRRNGRVDEHGNYESDDRDSIVYQWVGSETGYPGDCIGDDVWLATEGAKESIQDCVANINKYLTWDGRTQPND